MPPLRIHKPSLRDHLGSTSTDLSTQRQVLVCSHPRGAMIQPLSAYAVYRGPGARTPPNKNQHPALHHLKDPRKRFPPKLKCTQIE